MTTCKKQPDWYKETRLFYFRIRIPDDLRFYFRKKEIKKSPRTKDRSVANIRVAEEIAKFSKECYLIRARLDLAKNPTHALELNEETIETICNRYYYMALAGDEELRIDPDTNKYKFKHAPESKITVKNGILHPDNSNTPRTHKSRFLDYVAQMKTENQLRLFPRTKP